MMKERSEEIACVVVPPAVSEWLKCKNQGNDQKRSSEILGDEDSKFLINDQKKSESFRR